MPSNKLLRRKFPDIDKTLHIGITRLVEEYKRLAVNEEVLDVDQTRVLVSLSKTLIKWRREPAFKNLTILHETKIKDMRPPEEILLEVLRGDSYVEEENEDDSQSRF